MEANYKGINIFPKFLYQTPYSAKWIKILQKVIAEVLLNATIGFTCTNREGCFRKICLKQ